jgi:hypothetical protein
MLRFSALRARTPFQPATSGASGATGPSIAPPEEGLRSRVSERIRVRTIVGKSAADESAASDDDAQCGGVWTALLSERLFSGALAN